LKPPTSSVCIRPVANERTGGGIPDRKIRVTGLVVKNALETKFRSSESYVIRANGLNFYLFSINIAQGKAKRGRQWGRVVENDISSCGASICRYNSY